MRLKKMNAVLALAFGSYGLFGSIQLAYADTLQGSYTDIDGTFSTSGSIISGTSSQRYLTLGLETVSSDYTGDISNGIMAAGAAAGQSLNNSILGSGLSSILYTTSVTNTGSAASAYSFTINLSNSKLVVVPQYAYPDGAGTAIAQIGANIKLNGSSIWSSSAMLSTTSNNNQSFSDTNPPVYDLVVSGTGFASNSVQNTPASFAGTASEVVTFNPYSSTISLGMLAPGQTDTITYELTASAQLSGVSGGGFVGYGGAVANVGDPFGITGSPAFTVAPTAAVPEADTYAMMAAGLALVGVMTRRRQKRGFTGMAA